MKNQYEMKQTYLITLENEHLRERVKELSNEIRELKNKYEPERKGLEQDKRENATIQE
jgi:regulator of replication initiation timing